MSSKRTPKRAAIRIARQLVDEIRRRGLKPGTKLVSEHRMIEELGVARGTIREALRFLELQGALRIKAGPGGGPVVSVPGADHLASVLSLHLQFADASFRSVVQARCSIYPVLAAEAASWAGWGEFKPLLADALVAHLEPLQSRYREIVADPAYLDSVLAAGAEEANEVATRTLVNAKRAMGFTMPGQALPKKL